MLVRPSGKSNFNVLFLGLKLTRKSSLKGIIISLVPFMYSSVFIELSSIPVIVPKNLRFYRKH